MDEENFSGYLRLINDCDPDAPLLSRTPLGSRLARIPVNIVPASDLNKLTLALSVEQLIPTERGLARDYRGMAELMGFSSAEIEARFKKSHNSTKSLIDAYIFSHRSSAFSVNDLLNIIEQIERFDVIDDILPTLVKLACSSANHLCGREEHQIPAIDNIPHNSFSSLSVGNQQQLTAVDRLTFDDTSEEATNYDAFLCYAPKDIDEAQDLKLELESRGKRIATADDLLPGHFEHDALMRLIDLRCRKVILIVTRNFCTSEECKFQVKFASEVAIKGNELKIIPVLYEMIPPDLMPGMLKYTSKINMNDPMISRAMQFDKLMRSLNYASVANSNHHLMVTAAPVNRRTSSFNGQLTRQWPSEMAVQYSTGGDIHQSYSNGNSPLLSRTAITNNNHPIVELSHSQDSRGAIATSINRSSSPIGNSNPNIVVASSQTMVDDSSSSTRKWQAKLKNIFVPKRKPNHDIIYKTTNDSASFASESLLISAHSASHLLLDDATNNTQTCSHILSELK